MSVEKLVQVVDLLPSIGRHNMPIVPSSSPEEVHLLVGVVLDWPEEVVRTKVEQLAELAVLFVQMQEIHRLAEKQSPTFCSS